MFLRENITLLFFLALMLFFTSLITVKSQLKGQALNQNLRRSLLFILGLFSGLNSLVLPFGHLLSSWGFSSSSYLVRHDLTQHIARRWWTAEVARRSVKGSVFFQRSASLCHFLCRLVGHARCPGDDWHRTFTS